MLDALDYMLLRVPTLRNSGWQYNEYHGLWQPPEKEVAGERVGPALLTDERNIMQNAPSGQLMSGEHPIPLYRSHKRVHALQIKSVDFDEKAVAENSDKPFILTFVDERFPPLPVSDDWNSKHEPQPGYYWVRYADGYESCSPAQAFEEGYHLFTSEAGPLLPIDALTDQQISDIVHAGPGHVSAAADDPTQSVNFGIQMSQEPKYTTSRVDGRIINRATGAPIPDDEPVFIIRAQDGFAGNALAAYKACFADDADKEKVYTVIRRFHAWQFHNRNKVKKPD